MRILSVTAIVIILSLTITAQSSKKLSNIPAGALVKVTNGVGDIIVKSWNKQEIEAVYSNGESTPEVKQSGNIITISNSRDYYTNDDAIVVTVPMNANLDIATQGGGISIATMNNGYINAAGMGGDIYISNQTTGMIKLSTAGGDISVSSINGSLSIRYSGGDISVGNIEKNLDIVTSGGEVYAGSINGTAKITSSGGDIAVGFVKANATITTGGGNISLGKAGSTSQLKTAGGDIAVTESWNTLSASSGGGDIYLGQHSGSLDITSGSGDINVTLIGTRKRISTIKTDYGNVYLSLKSGLSLEVQAVKNYIREYDEDDFGISSFIKAEKVTVNKKTKTVTATYKLGSGENKLKVITGYGKISIMTK